MPPPPLPRPQSQKSKVWIIFFVVGLCGVLAAGILLAVLIPAVAKVQEKARRTVDQSSLRQVMQAALIWSTAHDGNLPPVHLDAQGNPSESEPATIHAVAVALARGGGLNDAEFWFSGEQWSQVDDVVRGAIIEQIDRGPNPAFLNEPVLAWDFATGLDISMPVMTPVAWTRGLQTDGTWSADGVYGPDGGHIAFLGGRVNFYPDLQETPLLKPDGSTTSNILESLPASVRVVGSGPGTLHGEHGRAAID